jgi:hypothetical protein
MKDVKDVLTVAVGHIQELETAERSRNLSRATQPLSSDRLVGSGLQQCEPLQSRILSGTAQSMSQDRLVGNGGETAPESYRIYTPHERLQAASDSYRYPQESRRQEFASEEPWGAPLRHRRQRQSREASRNTGLRRTIAADSLKRWR